MKQPVALFLVALVAAAAVAVMTASAGDPLTGKITLTAVTVEHHAQGVFPGAMETWQYSLSSIRRAANRPFGYMVLSCVRIDDGTTLRQCMGTASLPRGKLVMEGSFLYSSIWTLAVTGGGGIYIGAHGTVTSIQLHASTSTSTLTFTLN